MEFLIKFILFYSIFVQFCQSQIASDGINLNFKSLISSYNTNYTLLLKLNNEAVLNSPKFQFGESTSDKWLFVNGISNETGRYIYSASRLNDQLRYTCKPSVENCNSLSINRLNINDIGQYVRSGLSNDLTKITITSYLVSAYETPLNIKCYSPQGTCVYNSTTNTLNVRENDLVTLTCSSSIWRSSNSYTIAAEVFFKSQNEQYECQSNENRQITKINSDNSIKAQNIEMSKDCTRVFKREDTQFNCGLKYANEYSQSITEINGGIQNDIIDRISLNLNVHYGPHKSYLASNELNRTINYGTTVSLKCPFEGYPITYYWKVVTNDNSANQQQFNVGEREFLLPRSLQIGQYQYQCKAYVDGFVRNGSEIVQFNVNVVDLRTSAARKDLNLNEMRGIDNNLISNMPAIIGGTIGGLIGLIIVIILIVYILKCKRSSDDDIEKAKESEDLTKSNNSSNGNKQLKSILRKDKRIYKPKNIEEAEHCAPLNGDSSTDENNKQLNISRDVSTDLFITPNKPHTPIIKKTYPSINDQTKCTSEIVTTQKTKQFNAYSPSVAESRLKDAAAPDANLPMKTTLTGSRSDLAIKAGGYKVLPTEDKVYKLNQNPGESPPSYDAALQDTQESPKTLPKTYQPQQKHYQSQVLLPKDLAGSNSKIPTQFGGSNAKLSSSQQLLYNQTGTQSQLSNPHINGQIEYSNVVNINRARNRDPISSNGNLIDNQQQQPQTQYSSVTHFTLPKPINV